MIFSSWGLLLCSIKRPKDGVDGFKKKHLKNRPKEQLPDGRVRVTDIELPQSQQSHQIWDSLGIQLHVFLILGRSFAEVLEISFEWLCPPAFIPD